MDSVAIALTQGGQKLPAEEQPHHTFRGGGSLAVALTMGVAFSTQWILSSLVVSEGMDLRIIGLGLT